MDMDWYMAMFVTGCLITSSIVCKAQENVVPAKESHHARTVVPSETMEYLLDSLNKASAKKVEQDQFADLKDYKAKLKSLMALQFSDSVQIGIDRVKSGPLKAQGSEIVAVNPHLSPRVNTENISSKGYGVELRVKLD